MRALLLASLAASLSLTPLRASDVRVESAALPLNPVLTWDAGAEPPRAIALVREGFGAASPPYAQWIAAAEVFRDGRVQSDRYPYPGWTLEEMVLRGPVVRLSGHELYNGSGDFRTPENARSKIRLAGVFKVLHIEPGFMGMGVPVEMLTLQPIEWIRRDPLIEGPYFLMVPGGRPSVGSVTFEEAHEQVARQEAETGEPREAWAVFRPRVVVGDRVLVLESNPPVGPPRVLTTIGYNLSNLVVLASDGTVDAKWENLPTELAESDGADGFVAALRRVLEGAK